MDNHKLVEAVQAIARKAGDAILEVYNGDPQRFQVESKADESPLTLADRQANAVICAGLEALEVNYPIVSEENKAIPYAERRAFTYYWLVDPLDGTKEFIKRNGEFTVNIALVNGQTPVLGVVFAPVLDEMYWAVKGQGAWLAQNGAIQPLEAASFSMEEPGLKVVCSRSHLNKETQAFVDQLHDPELVAKGSSLKFLLLAKADAHLYPRLGPTMEWDTGAAQIVLEEAGGQVLEATTREPLRYNKEDLLNPYFIAYAKREG